MPEAVHPSDLVPMDLFEGAEKIKIDLVYANALHPENIFGAAAYASDARLTLHKDMARIVILTARTLNKNHDWTLVLKDGLRTTEAQTKLIDTDIVRRNPHWLQEPRLLSGHGQGAHPRGMAIDVSVIDAKAKPVDMGTVFDEMTPQSARSFDGFSPAILQNRKVLEEAFAHSAQRLSLPLLALPSEWWDFRLPASYNGLYAPLSETDLPPPLRMAAPASDRKWEESFGRLAKSILLSL